MSYKMNKYEKKIIAKAISASLELLEACPREILIGDIRQVLIDEFLFNWVCYLLSISMKRNLENIVSKLNEKIPN